MKVKFFADRNPKSIQQATLCFLVKDNEVLLAMKKRGFGVGLWNGSGGKIKIGESRKQAAKREVKEEVGIDVFNLRYMALLHFYFPDDPKKKDWNQDVHVFTTRRWSGEPLETEEMMPKWFKISEIPFDTMWPDDAYWLPHVLNGKKIEGWFAFDDNNKILDYLIKGQK